VTRPEWRQVARWLGVTFACAALVAAGMAIGWRLAGESTTTTELGRVSFEVEPSRVGDVEAFIPIANWGFRANAFDAPFDLNVELRTLDRPALLRAAEGDPAALDAAEDEVEAGARTAILRAFAWGSAVALLLVGLATAIWRGLRPRWALPAMGAAMTAGLTAACLWATADSFDAEAFERPTYFADGRELARILEVAEEERVRSGYGSEFASVLRGISTVLTDGGGPGPPGRSLYVASDLHANALVIEPLAQLIGDRPLLLAGDFGQRGGEAEAALLAPRVAALGERVVAVSGNHDTLSLMRSLARRGVTVLGADGRLDPSGEYRGSPLLDVDGLTVAGFPDPLEYDGGDPGSPDRPITFDSLPDGEERLDEAQDELVAWFDGLPSRPDVVMVHQNRLAQHLAAELSGREGFGALIVVTGDDHVQHVDRYDEIVVVDGGTVGAGGIYDAGSAPIGFAEMHLAPGKPTLRSVDLVAVEPFSGAARAARVVIASLCPGEDRCTYEPAGLDAGAAGP
jgi:hypothetical protein